MHTEIGVDLIEIARIARSLENPRFLGRVFSLGEQAYLAGLAHRRQQQSAAANFAAKEAFLKTLGPQIGRVKFCEIEVLREASGRPVLRYLGADERLRRGRYRVSLSHDRGRAVAVVLAQWEEDEA